MDITRLNRRDILNYQRRRTEQRDSAIIPSCKLEERRKAHNKNRRRGTQTQPGQLIVLKDRIADFDFAPDIA